MYFNNSTLNLNCLTREYLDCLQKTLDNNITFSLVLAFCKKNGTLIRVIDTLPWLMM